MKTTQKWLIALTFSLCVVACTSAQKRGEELMKTENYEEAAAQFERILQRDPRNAEAATSLKAARAKAIDKRLIEVRKARLGGKPDEAADLLLAVMQLQTRWQLQAGAQASFTQREEAELLSAHMISKMNAALAEKRPLKMEQTLTKYAPLFQENKTREFAAVKEKAKKQVQSDCAVYQKQNYKGLPYMAELLSKYCAHFGVTMKPQGHSVEEKNATLIRTLDFSGNIPGLPADLQSELEKELTEEFRKTPWYSARGGQTWKLPLDGKFEYALDRNPIQLVHEYDEQEKYIEMQEIEKTRQIPFEVIENRINPATGQMIPVKTTQYRIEKYYERQPVEKTRQNKKYFPYGAWNLRQNIVLDVRLNGELEKAGFRIGVNDHSKAEDTQSEFNMPNIGLKPKAANLPEQKAWVRSQITKLRAEFGRVAQERWRETRCAEMVVGDAFYKAGNQAQECLRAELPQFPEAVERWYQNHFGVDAGTVRSLLGVK